MTNLFGINTSDHIEPPKLDVEVFRTKRISEEQDAEIESVLENEEKLEKQSSLPFPLSLIKILCQIGWMILSIGLIKAWGSGTSLLQSFHNAPGIYLALPICFAIWFILQVISMRQRKKTIESSAFQKHNENANQLLQKMKDILGIPADAQSIDILAERYTIKDGNVKHKDMGMTGYDNLSIFIYTENNYLYLADVSSVWEIPLSSFRSIQLMNKRASFPDWTKQESYDSKTYKPYKITTNQFGHYFARYYRIEISDIKGEFYLLIPEYDGEIFMKLTGMYPDTK